MGDIEESKCDICGEVSHVSRKYYYYDIKCECCNGYNDNHFEIVRYCIYCEPKPPQTVKAWIKPKR